LDILKEMLAGEYAVVCARSGADALRLAKQCQPAVILLDVMMPGLDGLTACERIRHCPGLHDVVIIIVSAKAMPSERQAGFNAGADDYITKPFDEVELLSLMRHHTALRREAMRAAWIDTAR